MWNNILALVENFLYMFHFCLGPSLIRVLPACEGIVFVQIMHIPHKHCYCPCKLKSSFYNDNPRYLDPQLS